MEKLPTSIWLKINKSFRRYNSTEVVNFKTEITKFLPVQWLSYFSIEQLREVDIVFLCMFFSRYLALTLVLLYLWSSIHASPESPRTC
ncbi:hypothetical protein NSTC731_01311 [Nostoc sp. DSM 114167]|jgi:hypothetical protein